MGMPLRNHDTGFTYADYLTWPEGERWELIEGQAYAMSPAPSNLHQLIVGELFSAIHGYFRGKPCRPFVAPFDVRLPGKGTADHDIDTVVQPDISLVCDPDKLKDNHGCLGAPDWVIEVLSPSTAVHDQRTKRALFERHGVAEYWLVHPGDRSVTIYRLENNAYGKPLVYGVEDECSPLAFPELIIAVADIFCDLPPLDALA
jgi:Uma2 family endonuclease